MGNKSRGVVPAKGTVCTYGRIGVARRWSPGGVMWLCVVFCEYSGIWCRIGCEDEDCGDGGEG